MFWREDDFSNFAVRFLPKSLLLTLSVETTFTLKTRVWKSHIFKRLDIWLSSFYVFFILQGDLYSPFPFISQNFPFSGQYPRTWSAKWKLKGPLTRKLEMGTAYIENSGQNLTRSNWKPLDTYGQRFKLQKNINKLLLFLSPSYSRSHVTMRRKIAYARGCEKGHSRIHLRAILRIREIV